jgi:hypothetical protein
VGPGAREIIVARRGVLRHKWGAKFKADNGEVLTLTPARQSYHNLGDLKAMLAKYFPDWPVRVIGRRSG